VGANCRGFVNRSTIGVGVWRFVEGGEHGGAIDMVVARVYPALDPATVARSYVLLEFTIRQQVLGYNDEVGCFAKRLAVRLCSCLKGFSTPAYKGTWRGHHDGTEAES
jgi:hypothetical protein